MTFSPRPNNRLPYYFLLALLLAAVVACLTLLYPQKQIQLEHVQIQLEHVQVMQPALPGFSGPFTCNPTQDPLWKSSKISNRTFTLTRPPTATHVNNETEPPPYVILRWPTPTYATREFVKFDDNDACPYPVSLYPVFSYLNEAFEPSQRWPLGWAPCMLQRGQDSSGVCEDSAGQMIPYEYHGNFTKFEEASVIYLDYPFFMHKSQSPPYFNEEMFPPKRPHQPWWLGFIRGESLDNYPWYGMPAMLSRFDLTIGAPGSLFDLLDPGNTIPPYPIVSEKNPTPRQKRTDAPIAMMISNCESKNGRGEYLRELAKHVPIHSYGACMHNTDVPPEVLEELGLKTDARFNYDVKKLIFKQYKFVIAFENSNCEDYVTEKVWHAYEAKAIPIYMGAHNIARFLPHSDSYLNVANFSSPAELASHVLRIAGDFKLEQRYHAWRQAKSDNNTMPPENGDSILRQLYRIQDENQICRMLSRAVVAEGI